MGYWPAWRRAGLGTQRFARGQSGGRPLVSSASRRHRLASARLRHSSSRALPAKSSSSSRRPRPSRGEAASCILTLGPHGLPVHSSAVDAAAGCIIGEPRVRRRGGSGPAVRPRRAVCGGVFRQIGSPLSKGRTFGDLDLASCPLSLPNFVAFLRAFLARVGYQMQRVISMVPWPRCVRSWVEKGRRGSCASPCVIVLRCTDARRAVRRLALLCRNN
ncbi:hypothetical protein FA95DRAFT_91318 [Auriscalpium vulgare]|uniref:Uncharacterized protein n=1 Tax=Auriscalpium vulgare TaxID=40419 RepID=A0ACB8RN99_9AGAM|nr:hypothetical protein FA95DRAFT_91318 [Auriscalpium vulgare]